MIMTKAKLRKIWWAVILFYIALTYVTLGYMPTLWNKINAFFGGKGVVAQYIIYSIVGISVFIYMLLVKKERSIRRCLLFFLFSIIFLIMVKLEKNPGEKIHMAQYGLLGVLLYNTLKIDFDRFGRKLYLYAFIICLIVGAFDEVIQWILPNRCFTWHDVFINGLSGIITLLIIRFVVLPPVAHIARSS